MVSHNYKVFIMEQDLILNVLGVQNAQFKEREMLNFYYKSINIGFVLIERQNDIFNLDFLLEKFVGLI